jgi:hypothetical protein
VKSFLGSFDEWKLSSWSILMKTTLRNAGDGNKTCMENGKNPM